MNCQPTFASSSESLVDHPFASSSTTLFPRSIDPPTATSSLKFRKPSNSSLVSTNDHEVWHESNDEDTSSDYGAPKMDTATRARFPFQVAAHLVTTRPRTSPQMNEKSQALLSQDLQLLSIHSEDIPPKDLRALGQQRLALKKKADTLEKRRNEALDSSRLSWYDRQCMKFKSRGAEKSLYAQVKRQHKKIGHASESAMETKIDKTLAVAFSIQDKGKKRAHDDMNSYRPRPEIFHTAYAS